MSRKILSFSYSQGFNLEAGFEAEWDAAEKMLHIQEGWMKESAYAVTPERWKAFWMELEALGAWDWPAEANLGWNVLIQDGPTWSLEISDGKRHLQLSGATGMPRNQDGKKPFASLITAIKRLGGVSKSGKKAL